MNAAQLPAYLTDSSKLQSATVEIARRAYVDCRKRFTGTRDEFRAECIERMIIEADEVGYAAVAWACAAMSVVGDLGSADPERKDRATQLVLTMAKHEGPSTQARAKTISQARDRARAEGRR
jgi:hypothetical protein